MASMDLRTEHRQTQTLSPRLQHAVRLLQMSSLDFAAMVRDKLGQNPFLETEEGDDGEALPGADDAAERESERDSEPQELDGIAGNEAGDDRDMWQGDTAGSTRRAEDGEISAMEMMAVETTLNMHLHEQLGVLPLAHRDLMLARAIVESLDDDGYLRTPLEEVAQVLQLDPPPTLVELTIALKRVQSLDPAGVAARSVAECLQLQLGKIDCPQMRALAERIVGQHLQTLAAKDVNGLAHQLGETPARVEAVCDRIRRLDPRPGWHFGSTQVAYVVPDVLVRRVRGQWNVQLNPAVVPKVRFNQVYAELFQRHRSAQNTEMAGHLQDARWTLRNVEQRFSTILDVATAIVRRQRHFLEYGPMAMKPLVLREIADEVGIHESTVSRVTNNKYMATPIGVFELKYFFS
ncbi:RNA polymerase sigma-54 factor, partial [Rubrivivax gelatinosus]|uniref:RNA polymerase factor sigma-54 n=1 Tax=Rubrivivax gelatinosus TaxID=28068 RepID=UPI0019078400